MPNWSQLKENSSWTKPPIFQEKLAHDHLGRKRQLRTNIETIQAHTRHLGLKCLIFAVCFFCETLAILCNFNFAAKRHQVSKRTETAITWDRHSQTCAATFGLAVCNVCTVAGVLDPQTPHSVYFVQWGGLFYMDGVLNAVVCVLWNACLIYANAHWCLAWWSRRSNYWAWSVRKASGRNWWHRKMSLSKFPQLWAMFKHLELKILLLKKIKQKQAHLCNLYACCMLQFSPFTCASALLADLAYHLLALHTAEINRKWRCHVDMDLLWVASSRFTMIVY